MNNREGIRLYQLMGILGDGTAYFSISDDNGHEYCEEYGGLGELQEEPWYREIMDCPVTNVTTIGGGCTRWRHAL